jgi:uncharacterized membrane protein YfcA
MTEWYVLALGAVFAGFIDAVVGGGGLIQLPVLLSVFPTSPLATLFGTNKAASIWGTSFAAAQYARKVTVNWRALSFALGVALLSAWWGASLVSSLPNQWMRPLVVVLLIAVAVYTAWQPALGLEHHPRYSLMREASISTAFSAAIGFYDGFFGPGTGAFLVFAWVKVLGYDFLHASASAKFINIATNLAALSYFLPHGQVMWQVAILMAACNVLGARLGSLSAIKRGSKFVRKLFLCVVIALILKIARDLVIST